MLVAMMVLSLTACGGKKVEEKKTETKTEAKVEEKAEGKDESDWEIVVVPKDATNPWFVRMNTGVEAYQKETGLNIYQKGTPEIDATLQSQLIADLIASEVDAICVVPVDPGALEPVLKQAREAGIIVIAHEGASLKMWIMI